MKPLQINATYKWHHIITLHSVHWQLENRDMTIVVDLCELVSHTPVSVVIAKCHDSRQISSCV